MIAVQQIFSVIKKGIKLNCLIRKIKIIICKVKDTYYNTPGLN